MARPKRHDVDYFPFFAKRGKTLNILQSKYGLEGIGFFTNLLRFLALTPNHYYCIREEDDRLNFFAEIGLREEDKGIEMIELMVKTGKLDKELWEDHKVIASGAFLESLEKAYRKRSNTIITLDDIRAKFERDEESPAPASTDESEAENTDEDSDAAENNTLEVSGAGNPVNSAGNPVKGGIYPQSKVKKSKAKKRKYSQDFSDPLSESQQSALELSELLLSSHRKEIPDYLSGKKDTETIQRWAADIEKLIRIDKKTPDKIRRVILWAKTPGNFWFPNIQSGEKLRKHFEQIFGQMQMNGGKQAGTGPPRAHRIAADNIPPDDLNKYFT